MVAIGIGLSLVVGVILLAFAWPSLTASPKNLPVGIVGQDAAVTQIEKAIAEKSDGAIDLTRYDDRDAAVAAIERRKAYGAIVLGDAPTDAPEVLKATAASSQVAAVLDGLGRQLQAQIDAQIRTRVEQGVQKMQDGLPAAVRAAVQAALSGQAPQPPAASAPFQIPQV
ncbi:hypothetical protein KI686_15630, partial [Polaribacter sp. DS7-9]|nr:hypothetical protein [Polaribacter sp. DS7-9]